MPAKTITISSIMRELELSQELFALLFDCAPKQVYEWVNGKVQPGKLRREAILRRYAELKEQPERINVAREELKRRRREYLKPLDPA